MIPKRVSCLLLLGAVATVAGCTKEEDGQVVTPTVVAGLRYVNAVPDTGGMDIRVIDVVEDAPNTYNATFRTGGQPYGIAVVGLPQHTAVAAGTRHIRAFLNGGTTGNPGVASIVVLDTNLTFDANNNYTVYLWGYTYTGVTPRVQALVVKDSVSALASGKWALRVLNLAPTLAGNPAGAAATVGVDARVVNINSAAPDATVPASVTFSNVTSGGLSSYLVLDTNTTPTANTPLAYRLYATASGAALPAPAIFQAAVPTGTRGNATTQPVPGSFVAGTAITAIIVPQSVTGSPAPQTTPTAVTADIDSVTRSNDTVTVWRRIAPATATACAAPVAAGAAATDVVVVSGLTQAQYNGAHAVVSITAGAVPNRWTQRTVTLGGATGAFTLTFGGATSATLSNTATAAQVETALGAVSSIGAANVSVTGAAGGPYTVLFMGTFTSATVGTLSASAAGGLTATVTSPAVGCGTSALQTRDTVSFTGAAATDSFRVTVAGQTSAYVSVNATTAQVTSAITALSSVGTGTGNVTVTGAAGGPYVITFGGTLNNQNVAFSSALKTPTTATVAVGKAAFAFSGAATSSRYRFRIVGAPASPATGAASYKIVTGSNEFTSPQVLFIVDQLPSRTAP